MKPAQALGILALAAAVAFPAAAFGQAPVTTRHTYNWAYGQGTTTSSVETSTQTYGSLNATEQYDVKGLSYENTRIDVTEQLYSASSFGYRTLGCTVDRTALRTNSKQAAVSASLDPNSSSCFTWGYYCDDTGCGVWGYSGIVGVSGAWHDSRYTTKSIQNSQTTDNLTGTSWKQNCQISRGDESKGGFAIGANTYLFGPLANGSFGYSNCNTNNK
jgi:hypothetical protein